MAEGKLPYNTEFHTIYDAIPSLYFDGRKEEQTKKISKKQIILSCYLREE